MTYVEVTYSDKRINSFFAKLGKNKNILFGARQSGDKTQSWGFDDYLGNRPCHGCLSQASNFKNQQKAHLKLTQRHFKLILLFE